MRSQLSFRLGIALSRFAQAAASESSPAELQVTVKFILVPQSEICKGPYKPGRDCSVTAQRAESIKDSNDAVSRAYQLSAGKSVALPLEPKFQSTLMPCIDAGDYAILLEFDWGQTLLAVVDLVRDSSDQMPEFNRGQASPYSPFARNVNSGKTMQASAQALWYTHQNASDFEPARRVKWKLIINDTWYGFYVKSGFR